MSGLVEFVNARPDEDEREEINMAQVATGWYFEIGTTERADDNGWMITEPTDNARFECAAHEYDSGWLPKEGVRQEAQAHIAEQHPGEENPFDRPLA